MKKNHSKNIFFFMCILTIVIILFLFPNNLIQDASALNITGKTFIRPDPPTILSITASDPNNISGYSNGDTITVRFSAPTNMPQASTKSQLDTLFSFSQSLGNDYTGTYTDSSTLVITIADKGAANPTIGGFTLTVIGGLTNAAGTSLASTSTSPVLAGSFGSAAGPYITSIVSDDPNNISGYSNGDTITVRFSAPTNMPGGTGTLDNSTVSSLFTFSQKLGSGTSGQWINPLTFRITINDITSNGNPRIGVTTVQPNGQVPIKNSDGTSLPSTGISPVLTGSFGTFVVVQDVGQGASAINTLPSGIVSTVKLPSDSNGTITVQKTEPTSNSASGGGTIQFIGETTDITPGDGASCHSGCDISFTFTRNDLPAGKSPADVTILHDANNDGRFDGPGEQLSTAITEGPTGVFTATAHSSFNSNFGMGIVTPPPPPSKGGSSVGSAPSFSSVILNTVSSGSTSISGGVTVSGLYPTKSSTKIIGIGEPSQIKVILSNPSSSVSNIEHVGLYLDLYGSKRNVQDSDAYISYDKYEPLETFDRNGLFSKTGVTTTNLGSMLEVTFNMTFAKPMGQSDIIIRTWDLNKRFTDINISDAIEVIKKQYAPEVPYVTILQNDTVTSNSSLENSNSQNSTNTDLLPTIKKWGGYSSEFISDSELLKVVGINAHHIPTWFMKTSKWVISDDVTQQEFVSALKYMYEKGIIK